MTDAAITHAGKAGFAIKPHYWPWIALLAMTIVLLLFNEQFSGLVNAPQAIAPFEKGLTAGWNWLITAKIFGLISIDQITRWFANLLIYPMRFVQSLLAPEVQRPQWLPKSFPSIPWFAIAGMAAIAGHYAGGIRTALMMFAACCYFAFFGMWNSTMETAASILFAVPVGLIIGVLLGIKCFKSERARAIITPVLDLMQTVPFFSYMMPIVTLFGLNPVAALIVTIIFAIPPMVRVTDLALREVPPEVVDFGRMAGCKPRQLMWLVRLPAARDGLLVGLNQVVMLTLNLVILASVIGARGLGFDVWNALNRLNIGKGLEFGMAIVILAIVLDRYLRRLALRRPTERTASPLFHHRHPYWTAALALLVIVWALSFVLPFLAVWPKAWTVTTAPFWNALMTWINTNFFDALNAMRGFLVGFFLNPYRDGLLALPWISVVAALALLGWQLQGLRLALLASLVALAIAATGLWTKTGLSVYECSAAVIVCGVIGFPLGVWAARSDRVWRIVEPLADLLQTIPSFIFLIPFVILFRTGEFTAILIVITFAIVPAIRYTAEGIRNVPAHLIEAARAQGCSNWQILREVQLPLAFPSILLGLNQTILMALSMLVITAYAGTNDLGQDSLAGVMNRNFGKSVLAGLAIAGIAIVTDRLIRAKAQHIADRMGLKIA
jgi:glycine betaine/proline transport system permease protein